MLIPAFSHGEYQIFLVQWYRVKGCNLTPAPFLCITFQSGHMYMCQHIHKWSLLLVLLVLPWLSPAWFPQGAVGAFSFSADSSRAQQWRPGKPQGWAGPGTISILLVTEVIAKKVGSPDFLISSYSSPPSCLYPWALLSWKLFSIALPSKWPTDCSPGTSQQFPSVKWANMFWNANA